MWMERLVRARFGFAKSCWSVDRRFTVSNIGVRCLHSKDESYRSFQISEIHEITKNDKNSKVVIYKPDQSGSQWVVSNRNHHRQTCNDVLNGDGEIASKLIERATSKFLPNGYPESVEKGYGAFSVFQFFASSCSSALMVLSTQTLLVAIGLTSGEALGLSATLNWVIKDGVGQFGGILFANYLGKHHEFDSDPKKWRMISGLALDAACMIELAAPLLPSGTFLLSASIANVGKNISFLSASASRAAIHQSIAKKQNLADITAMAVSQGIVASLLGTTVGCLLSPYVINNYTYLGICALVLSLSNQASTYLSLKAIPVKTLNLQRLHHVFKSIFVDNSRNRLEFLHCLPCPEKVSKIENLFNLKKDNEWLDVGNSIESFCSNPRRFTRILQLKNRTEKYIINVARKPGRGIESKIYINFFLEANDVDVVRGIYHCYIIKKQIILSDYCDLARDISIEVERDFPKILKHMQKLGWKVDADGIKTGKRVLISRHHDC